MRTIIVSLPDVSLQPVRLPTPPQRRSSRGCCSKRCRGKWSRGQFFKLYLHCNICTICHLWNMLPSLISLPGTGGIFCAWIYVHLDRIDIYDWCNLVCNGYSLQVKEINRLSLVRHFVSPFFQIKYIIRESFQECLSLHLIFLFHGIIIHWSTQGYLPAPREWYSNTCLRLSLNLKQRTFLQ